MIRVLVPLANGVEEMEAVIPVDIFRRAGWTVTTAGLVPGPVAGAHQIVLSPDALLQDVMTDSFDLLFLPGGGGGTEAMRNDARVLELVRKYAEAPRWVAAICAAPLVLDRAGVLAQHSFTCYPGVEPEQGTRKNDRIVQDRRIYTSKGPGTAFEFALRLVADLESPAKSKQVAEAAIAP